MAAGASVRLEGGASGRVLALAGRMAGAQTGEVALMRDMLRERDAEPREDVDAWLAEQAADDADESGTTEGHDDGH